MLLLFFLANMYAVCVCMYVQERAVVTADIFEPLLQSFVAVHQQRLHAYLANLLSATETWKPATADGEWCGDYIFVCFCFSVCCVTHDA